MNKKDEILKGNGIYKFDEYNLVYENVKRSMDEWAKYIHFEFKKWIDEVVKSEDVDYLKRLSSEHLYELFLMNLENK